MAAASSAPSSSGKAPKKPTCASLKKTSNPRLESALRSNLIRRKVVKLSTQTDDSSDDRD